MNHTESMANPTSFDQEPKLRRFIVREESVRSQIVYALSEEQAEALAEENSYAYTNLTVSVEAEEYEG